MELLDYGYRDLIRLTSSWAKIFLKSCFSNATYRSRCHLVERPNGPLRVASGRKIGVS